MTTMPAPVGFFARAACAMKRVLSAETRCRSYVLAEPPAMGGIGGRESLSTHMGPPGSVRIDAGARQPTKASGHRQVAVPPLAGLSPERLDEGARVVHADG